MIEYPEAMIIEVTPNPKESTDWGGNKYFVKVNTDPFYEGLDEPIALNFGEYVDGKDAIAMEPNDAEVIAKALLRAVEIYRGVFPPNAEITGERSDSGASTC